MSEACVKSAETLEGLFFFRFILFFCVKHALVGVLLGTAQSKLTFSGISPKKGDNRQEWSIPTNHMPTYQTYKRMWVPSSTGKNERPKGLEERRSERGRITDYEPPNSSTTLVGSTVQSSFMPASEYFDSHRHAHRALSRIFQSLVSRWKRSWRFLPYHVSPRKKGRTIDTNSSKMV